jgi:hypothetical protein
MSDGRGCHGVLGLDGQGEGAGDSGTYLRLAALGLRLTPRRFRLRLRRCSPLARLSRL